MAGRMGMSEKEFLHTTPRYFYFRQKGFEGLQNEYWMRSRNESFYAFLPHAKKNTLRKPSDLFKLPGDEADLTYSEQEKAALLEHLSRAKSIDFFTGESQNAQA